MTDVLEIALKKRAMFREECAKLDEFLTMGEALVSGKDLRIIGSSAAASVTRVERSPAAETSGNDAEKAPGSDTNKGDGVPKQNIFRRAAGA